jgi:hydrogenase maturation protein HypF
MSLERRQITVAGIVQGVGFRPFIYRLAGKWQLSGWVCNTPAGVLIEVQGERADVQAFLATLPTEAPPLAAITDCTSRDLPPVADESGFGIRPSTDGLPLIQVAPDSNVCSDCLRELLDPADRRFRHPFITCTNCGPRYSIITGIPYDRPLTTMAPFPLCADCRAEYVDPDNRRFHAQPLACPQCGPRLSLVGRQGQPLPGEPIATAADLLRAGRIVAIKGVGGFHLAVDATNSAAVAELRRRKQREEKPFAVMVADLSAAGRLVQIDPLAARLLTAPECPIVILSRQAQGGRAGEGPALAANIAPGNGYLGVMLPATPVQHLLLAAGCSVLVMTSGNRSDEPIACDNAEALATLGDIADAFLLHDRAIRTRCDDSVMRVFRGDPLFYRRARGYVPRAIRLPVRQPALLAVGAELKGTICLTRGDEAFPSQHLGDLQNAACLAYLRDTSNHLQHLLEITPTAVAHDLHPDFLSSRHAEETGLPLVGVQHHHAHLAACLAEHRVSGEAIGIIFDGTGYGPDGTVWGGEFLVGGVGGVRRAGHLRQVPLPGGDAAIREPQRMALAYLHDAFGASFADHPLPPLRDLDPAALLLYRQMLERRLNSPLTSSCGRLFDAVAALLDVRQRVSYEGQAAIELEALAETGVAGEPFPFALHPAKEAWELDFRPLIKALVTALAQGKPRANLARTFHRTLAQAALAVCRGIRLQSGHDRVALSGGVFQNRLLTEELADTLEAAGFTVLVHRLLPPNDGCISLGQAVVAGQYLASQSAALP